MIMVIRAFAQILSGQALSVNVISMLVIQYFIMCIQLCLDQQMKLIVCVSDRCQSWWRLFYEFAYFFRICSNQICGWMMTTMFANQGWGNIGEFSLVIPKITCNLALQLHTLLYLLSLQLISTSSSWIPLLMATSIVLTPSGT